MWSCDVCGGKIEHVDDGWVEWVTVPKERAPKIPTTWPTSRGLRLVHSAHYHVGNGSTTRCQYRQTVEHDRDGGLVADLPLGSFLGPDGLTQLLEMLARDDAQPRMDVARMIMRLHVPNYEQARPNLDRAVAEGTIEPNLAPEFHWQSELKAVIKQYT